MSTYKVNNLVSLQDAWDLKDFLVVTFRSENSVVYYKIEKYDYTITEHNLRGFDPTNIWLEQMSSNQILVCQYKLNAKVPFMIFRLEGDNLIKAEDPDVGSFSFDTDFRYLAASVIKESYNEIYLYVALTYPASLSFVKYKF